MSPQPVVTGLSPKDGPPGTRITIRGEFLGSKPQDLIGLTICECDCLLSAEWKSPNKIIARTGAAKGKGDIIVTTTSGGIGTSTVQFRAYHETIGPMKESAVWVEESPMQSLAWGRRSLAPSGYSQEDPLGLSIEGNDDKKFPEDLRDIFPDSTGDLSQDNFSPGWFLLEHHHATSFDDLKAGLMYLRRKVEGQKEGQLSFLKSNAGSVIDQLDTLVTLRSKFTEDAEQYGTEPIQQLESSILKSITESHNLFNDVLSRREKADSTRAALGALSRYKFLFCLPNSVDQHAKKEEYDIVLNDYIRAKNLFGKSEVPIFKKFLNEVDVRIIEVRKTLYDKLKTMPQSVDQQKRFVKALINLEMQQQNIPAALEKFKVVDPAWDAIEARSNYLEAAFRRTFEQFTSKNDETQMKNRNDQNSPPNRVLFCEEITEVAANQLPDLWRLGQAYFTGELRGISEPKPGNFKRIILNGIEKLCNYLRAALLPQPKNAASGIIWPSSSISAFHQSSTWIPHCLRYVRITYATLIRIDLPSEALDIILKLIDEIRLYCLVTIFKRGIDKVKKLGEKETWEMPIADFPGATNITFHLEAILIELLEEGQTTCLTPETRENILLEPNSEGQREISQCLQDILGTFCSVIESLAFYRNDTDEHSNTTTTVSQLIGLPLMQNSPSDESKLWSSFVPWEQRLLCSLANCSYCNKVFFPNIVNLFQKFSYPQPKLAIESSRSKVNSLFTNILETYVEHKSDPLVGTIEPSMYLGKFQWNNVKKIGKLRPYAQECLDNIVGVYSEIFTISPILLRPVLEPIVQTVAEELARLMSCVQKFNADGAIQANVDIRLLKDALKLYSNESAKSFFQEALDAIPGLSEQGKGQVNNIINDVKLNMRLQLMSLSIARPY